MSLATAREIKESFTRHLVADGQIVASEVGVLMHPDLVAIDKRFWVSEYEIKVDLYDLRKELEYIEMVIEDQKNHVILNSLNIPLFDPDATQELNRTRKKKTYDNKYRKHREYQFHGFEHSGGIPTPNRFYFLIPSELYEKEKTRIDAIPFYGVINCRTYLSLKKCTPIHKETATPFTVFSAARSIQYKHIVNGTLGASEEKL